MIEYFGALAVVFVSGVGVGMVAVFVRKLRNVV